jgi:hypothetical protein
MRIPDLRRWATCQSFGSFYFVLRVQGDLDDARGALQAGEYGTLAIAARKTIVSCLSTRGFTFETPERVIPSVRSSGNFDGFQGIDEQSIADALGLANLALDVSDQGSAESYFRRLEAYVDETEKMLGLEEPLPRLRTRSGNFGIVRLARTWDPLMSSLQLPTAFPSEWGDV